MTHNRGWLSRTGQRWKIYVFLSCNAAVGLLLALLIRAVNVVPEAPPEYSTLLGVSIAVLGGFGLVWLLVAVRCALCGYRPAWDIVRTHAVLDWFPALLGLTHCPRCETRK